MGTAARVAAAVAAFALAGCAGAATSADGATVSELPIAAAPSGTAAGSAGASPSASEAWPDWDEPQDPVAAYRVLLDKVAWLRAHPRPDLVDEVYAAGSPAEGQRADLQQMADRGVRIVDGRTVIEDTLLVAKDDDTTMLEVQAREEGWTRVRRDGRRSDMSTMCEEYVVELHDAGAGWRIAAVHVDDEDIQECDR